MGLWVHLEDVKFLRLGENAALMEIGEDGIWVPYSQMGDGEESKVRKSRHGEVYTLTVTKWWADKAGVDYGD